jgi:hypothetical protein
MASQEGSRQPVVRVAQDLRPAAINAVPVVESTVSISQVAAARGNRQASMRAWQQDLEEQSAKRRRWIVPHKELDCALAVCFRAGGKTNKDGLPKDEVVRSHGT